MESEWKPKKRKSVRMPKVSGNRIEMKASGINRTPKRPKNIRGLKMAVKRPGGM